MVEGANQPAERISPIFRQLRNYVTGDSYDHVVESLPRINDLWRKLTSDEQVQYRQLLLRRHRELTSLWETENATATEGDRDHYRLALAAVELMRARIDALSPSTFGELWDKLKK